MDRHDRGDSVGWWHWLARSRVRPKNVVVHSARNVKVYQPAEAGPGLCRALQWGVMLRRGVSKRCADHSARSDDCDTEFVGIGTRHLSLREKFLTA